MIKYNDFDIQCVEGFESILEYFNLGEVTDEKVWEVARLSTEMPLFENILIGSVLNIIERHLIVDLGVSGEDVRIEVNAAASFLSVFGERIVDIEDLKMVLSENGIDFER